MRITKLRLQNVKRHADLALEPAPGLTVVRGPNEAGKSTVQQALEIALFRKPTSTAQELGEVRRWGGANDEDPVVELSFENDGVEGRLSKRFAGPRGTVELRYDGAVHTDPNEVAEVVARLTGLPSERFYRATASIHHHELIGLEQDEATLRDRLQQSMSGADRGTRAARKKLEDARHRYRTEGHKKPGYLKVARAEVESLEAAVADGEAALSQLESDRQALVEARDRRAVLDDQLAQYRQALEASERALKLAHRAAEADKRYELYKRAEDLRLEIESLEAAHPSRLPLDELRHLVAKLRDHEFRLSEIHAELAVGSDSAAVPPPPQVPRWMPMATLAAVLVVGAVLALAAGFLLDQPIFGALVAIAVGAGALVTGGVAIRRRRRRNEVLQRVEMHEIDLAKRLRGISDRTDQLRQNERDRKETLELLGLANLAEAEGLLQAEVEHTGRIETVRAELRGVLGGDSPSEPFAVLRDRAANEADACRHALADLREIGSEPEKFNSKLKTAVARAEQEREAALTAEAQADARLEANRVDAEVVAGQAESLVVARERLAGLERRLRIYDTVLSVLDEAERSTMKKAARYLEEQMAGDIEKITNGRYRRLRVDEAKLAFSVYSAESGDWVDVRHLSQGTLDQLYLCARLGIVRQVTQPATPPLVLDDPFVTFDDGRARRALELLRSIAADYQIILLTCSDRFDELADLVIELPAPTLADEPAGRADQRAGVMQQALDLDAEAATSRADKH